MTESALPPTPSFSPTPLPTSPGFNAEVFKQDLAKLETTESITDVTMAPTVAPTPAPTKAGFKVVEKEIATKAVLVSIKFAMAVEDAQNPVMQHSMRSGFAGAVGISVTYVEIVDVTKSAAAARRLQGGFDRADVKFKLTSPDPNNVAQLEKDVKERAAEGAVIAKIIKKAAENKVLTPNLANMDIKVTVQTSVVATTTTTTEVVKLTKAKQGSGSGLTDAEVAGIVIGAVACVALVAFVVHAHTKKLPKSKGPVVYSKTEGALSGAQ